MTKNFGTIGIEIEYTGIPQDFIYTNIHDASVETLVIDKYNNRYKLGGEIVSPVLYNYYQVKDWVKNKINILRSYGESVDSYNNRDSIHIHIGYPATNYEFLIKTLKWAVKIDEHLIKLGGMGKRPRGFINDFLYYRPLCSPQVIQTRNGYGRVFNVNDIMKVKTEKGFWTRYGDSLNITSRYVASRYTSINFYSIGRHGTIEFRMFNKLLLPTLISTIAEFLSRSIINVVSGSMYKISRLSSFEDFLIFSGISKKKIDLLFLYYEKSKFTHNEYIDLCNQNLLSHLVVKERSPIYYRNTKYCPEVIPEYEIKEPIITDVHSGNYTIKLEE